MQNSMLVFSLSVLDWKICFWNSEFDFHFCLFRLKIFFWGKFGPNFRNCQFNMKFGKYVKFDFGVHFFCFRPFFASFVPKIHLAFWCYLINLPAVYSQRLEASGFFLFRGNVISNVTRNLMQLFCICYHHIFRYEESVITWRRQEIDYSVETSCSSGRCWLTNVVASTGLSFRCWHFNVCNIWKE